jgi:hypothetical protein
MGGDGRASYPWERSGAEIVAHRDGTVIVADTQVVSGVTPLEIASERKRAKYDSKTVLEFCQKNFKVSRTDIKLLPVTISWRGVWKSGSAKALRDAGVPRNNLAEIAMRVLWGSYLNFNTFNRRAWQTRQGSCEVDGRNVAARTT